MTSKATVVEVSAVRHTPDELVIEWKNAELSAYQALWLRDNDPAHRDALTGQRLISVADLPAEPHIESAEESPGGAVTVQWRDGVRSVYPLAWLRAMDRQRKTAARPVSMPWMGQPASHFAWCAYDAWLAQAAAREDWLERAARDGLAFLRGVPVADRGVLEVAAEIGYVRETNYGRIFDVRTVSDPNHLACTSPGLRVHTDNPYRDPVPGFQLLHCLAAAGEGGESLFVDGLAVAERLRARHPDAFAILSQTPVRYHFQDDDVDLSAERTMIDVDAQGRFRSITYNDSWITPLFLRGSLLKRYYAAYRQLATLLDEPARSVRYGLQPGELVLFDNTRILHGRTASAMVAVDGQGSARHLQGCSIDADGLYSSLAVLARKRSAQ